MADLEVDARISLEAVNNLLTLPCVCECFLKPRGYTQYYLCKRCNFLSNLSTKIDENIDFKHKELREKAQLEAKFEKKRKEKLLLRFKKIEKESDKRG